MDVPTSAQVNKDLLSFDVLVSKTQKYGFYDSKSTSSEYESSQRSMLDMFNVTLHEGKNKVNKDSYLKENQNFEFEARLGNFIKGRQFDSQVNRDQFTSMINYLNGITNLGLGNQLKVVMFSSRKNNPSFDDLPKDDSKIELLEIEFTAKKYTIEELRKTLESEFNNIVLTQLKSNPNLKVSLNDNSRFTINYQKLTNGFIISHNIKNLVVILPFKKSESILNAPNNPMNYHLGYSNSENILLNSTNQSAPNLKVPPSKEHELTLIGSSLKMIKNTVLEVSYTLQKEDT